VCILDDHLEFFRMTEVTDRISENIIWPEEMASLLKVLWEAICEVAIVSQKTRSPNEAVKKKVTGSY